MSNDFNQVVLTGMENWGKGVNLVAKLFSVAQPGAVYSEPVTAADQTIITASEVSVGMGFGYGAGGGTEPGAAEGESATQGAGMGGGGGGGGASSGRPVAVVSVGPKGVRVEPVVDVTKIAIAFITALGAMLITLNRMRRAGRR
jgi:uncharacterized spore protein YtfJ